MNILLTFLHAVTGEFAYRFTHTGRQSCLFPLLFWFSSSTSKVYQVQTRRLLQDWTEHKLLCKQLQKVNAYDMDKGHTLLDPTDRLKYYLSEEV